MPDLLDRLKAALADRYRVDREIGRGGMARVFLAHDLKLDRSVALKVLRPDLAAVVGRERFRGEIQLDRDPDMAFLNTYPVFDPLRGHPRFQDLLRRMDFPN